MDSPVEFLSAPAAPGVLPKNEFELRQAFLQEVKRIPGGGKLNQCIQCGTCSGSCPVSYAMDFLPREVVALFRAGAIETLLRSRTIWICASCYNCTVRCPAGIEITDLLYALKRIALEQHILPAKFPVYALSESFAKMVRKYGRNHELGLLRAYFLRTSPWAIFRRLGEGVALWWHGRLRWKPKRIKGLKGLRRMILRAEQFERPQERVVREKVTEVVGYEAIDAGRAIP